MTRSKKSTEDRFVGTNWDAEVSVKYKSDRQTLARKVKTRGVRYVAIPHALKEAVDFLRMGYEVYLNDGTTERVGVRLYPLVDTNYECMSVCASTAGSFRTEPLKDKKFRIVHNREEIDVDEAIERGKEGFKGDHDAESVTPDTMVTCPRCGERFRVGRCLSK